MQLLVVGATGGTGQQAVEQALDRGHYVTAFVRDPTQLPVKHQKLTVIQGDVLKPETLWPAVQGQDAVFCTLGSRPGQHDLAVVKGTENLIAAMQQAGARRLLVVSSLGVGNSYAGASLPSKLFIKTVLYGVIIDKELQEEAIRESGLDWIIARPTRLTNNPAAGQYTVAEQIKFPILAMPQVSRADVAAFLLDQLDTDIYLHKAVVITSK